MLTRRFTISFAVALTHTRTFPPPPSSLEPIGVRLGLVACPAACYRGRRAIGEENANQKPPLYLTLSGLYLD